MTGSALALAVAERRDLADFLSGLNDAQWETASLCEGWTVRQVVAHLISYEELGWLRLAAAFARGRFDLDRVNATRLARYDDRTPEELLALVRSHLTPRGVTALRGGGIALTDAVIHHQDIRRSLDAPREVPHDRLRSALDFSLRAPALPTPKVVRGLSLRATDLDWAAGEGPEVTGPGEALLLAAAGRPVALADLSGPGLATLRQRIGAGDPADRDPADRPSG